jgi:outer membrane receptor for ferrienterochelin and colicin
VRIAWDGFGGEKSWHHLGVSADTFFFQVEDLIALSALVPITGQSGHFTRSYINVKEHRSYGGSISSYLQVKNLNLKAGVGYVALWNDLEQYDQIPEYQGAWEANFQSNYQWTATGANLALFYKYRGPKPGFVQARDGSLSELTLREAHQMDMTLQFPLFANKLALEAGIENLFNNENLDQIDLALGTAHAEIPVGWGRTYSARIRYQF